MGYFICSVFCFIVKSLKTSLKELLKPMPEFTGSAVDQYSPSKTALLVNNPNKTAFKL